MSPRRPSNRAPLLHVITRLESGGAPRSLLLLLQGLRARGLPVELAAGPSPPGSEALTEEARRLEIPLHLVSALRRAPCPWHDLRALIALHRLYRARRPRLVHLHTSKAGFLGRLAAVTAGVPVRVYTPRGTILEGYFGGWRLRLYTALDRLAARWTDVIIGLTPEESQSYLEAGIGRPEQHVQIPVHLDPAPFRPPPSERRRHLRSGYGVGEAEVVIASVGRLVPVKDQGTLIEALARLPADLDWSAWIIGEGPDRAPLQTLAEVRGIAGRVRFWGHREDVADLLGLADIFALSSVNEGLGRVVLEAFAARLAVIATRVGGIPTVVDRGRAGLLVPPRDPAALAWGLEQLIRSRRRRTELAEAAQGLLERYSAERVISDHLTLYERLLSPTRRPGGTTHPA